VTITTNGGIILSINGTDVALGPKDVSDALKKGASYELSAPIAVGSAQDLSTFLTDQFGAPALPPASSFPAPLDSVYNKVTNLVLTVDKFKVVVPPSQNADGTPIPPANQKATSFSIGISAVWPPGQEVSLIPGKLAIKGLFLQVDKDDTP